MGIFDGIGNWIGSGVKNIAQSIGTGAKNVASFIGSKIKPNIGFVGDVAKSIGDLANNVSDFIPGAGLIAKGASWVSDKIKDGSVDRLADRLQRLGEDVSDRANKVDSTATGLMSKLGKR